MAYCGPITSTPGHIEGVLAGAWKWSSESLYGNIGQMSLGSMSYGCVDFMYFKQRKTLESITITHFKVSQ